MCCTPGNTSPPGLVISPFNSKQAGERCREGKLKYSTLPNLMAMWGAQLYVQRLSKEEAEKAVYSAEPCMHFKNTQPALYWQYLFFKWIFIGHIMGVSPFLPSSCFKPDSLLKMCLIPNHLHSKTQEVPKAISRSSASNCFADKETFLNWHLKQAFLYSCRRASLTSLAGSIFILLVHTDRNHTGKIRIPQQGYCLVWFFSICLSQLGHCLLSNETVFKLCWLKPFNQDIMPIEILSMFYSCCSFFPLLKFRNSDYVPPANHRHIWWNSCTSKA